MISEVDEDRDGKTVMDVQAEPTGFIRGGICDTRLSRAAW
jgi:hypothetical protein